jgi:hypothetical protein
MHGRRLRLSNKSRPPTGMLYYIAINEAAYMGEAGCFDLAM